jgi:hypothetical protein
MCKFDPSKPVQTRDGRKARIICTDRICDMPILALVPTQHGKEFECVWQYKADGTTGVNSDIDLINIPEVKKEYRLVTLHGTNTVTKYEAVEAARAKMAADKVNWAGISETVYTDGNITEINFIPKE